MKSKHRLSQIIIFVFAFIIYANTIGHEYALDDKAMITHNEFTQKGFGGIWDILSYDTMAGMFGKDSQQLVGGRYRPLSVVTFAIEQEFFNGNPHISHFINIILYAISLLILYNVLTKLFRNYKPRFRYLSIPFVASMLFAAHPLHTEIVANIKGRDEILAFLFSIAALNSIINYFDENKKYELVNAFVFIFLGSMSKEITITFLAVIPLSIYFFRDYPAKKYLLSILPVGAGAMLYLLIRHFVIGDQSAIEAGLLMNNPFLEATTSQRYATVIYTLGIYIRLIIFPHPQTWDYYPYHIQLMDFTDTRVILSLIVHLALIFIAVKGFRKKSIFSYAILFYAATLSITSNIFFNIGAFMSERFVFVSLLGFCIVFAYVLTEKLPVWINHYKKYRKTAFSLLCIVLLLYSFKTISRNTVWKNSLTLFENDVKVSHNSAKSNSSYASELYSLAEQGGEKGDTVKRNQLLKKAKPYFKKAIEIYPGYAEALVRLGNSYYILYDDYKTMFEYYLQTLDNHPLDKDVWNNTIGVLVHNVHEPEYEKYLWSEIIMRSPDKWDSYYYLGELYFQETPQNNDSAIHYFEIAKAKHPEHFRLLKNLGICYGNVRELDLARENFFKAINIRQDAETFWYIGLSYGLEDNDEMALKYFEKAYELEPENPRLKEDMRRAQFRLEQNNPG